MAYQKKSQKTIACESASHHSADPGVLPDLETTVDRGLSSNTTRDRMQRPNLVDNWSAKPVVAPDELNVIESFFSELVDEIIKG